MGYPTSYTPDDIPLEEVVSTTHRAMSQVQCVLHREHEGLDDEHRCLQLCATMLQKTTVYERVAARAWQRDFDL
jgi:hypothetical protein